jgi:hypothetical protein
MMFCIDKKAMTAKAIATESSINFISVKGPALLESVSEEDFPCRDRQGAGGDPSMRPGQSQQRLAA